MAKRRTQYKQPQKPDPTDINQVWAIVIQEAPEWLGKPEQTLPLPSKHSWSEPAKRIILRAVRETRLTRKNIATLLDGRLDGGLPVRTGTVTGLLRRSQEDEGVFIMPRQERPNTQLALSPYIRINSDFDLEEIEIKPGLDFAAHERTTYLMVKPEGPARYYLENLAEDECQFATGETHKGVALHCGCKCKPKLKWGKHGRKFHAFCPTHVQQTQSQDNEMARASFLKEIPRLLRYA